MSRIPSFLVAAGLAFAVAPSFPAGLEAQDRDTVSIEGLLQRMPSLEAVLENTEATVRVSDSELLEEFGWTFRAFRYDAPAGSSRVYLSSPDRSADPVLLVMSEDEALVEYNDDSPFGGLDAFVQFETREPRSLLVVATHFGDQATTLDLRIVHAAAGADGRPLGQAVFETPGDFAARVRARRQELFDSQLDFGCKGRDDRAIEAVSDAAHPRRFATILEVTSSGDTLMLYAPGTYGVEDRVDAGSDVLVRFDPKWFLEEAGAQQDARISVQARLVGPDGSRSLEVSGYSLVGARQRRAVVGIKSVERWEAIVCPVIREWERVGSLLHAALLEDMDSGASATFYKEYARDLLAVSRAPLRSVMSTVTASENQPLLESATLMVERDWSATYALAEDLGAQFDALVEFLEPNSLPPDIQLRAFIEGFTSLQDRLRGLAEALIDAEDGARTFLLQGLKDGEVTLSESGARRGDRLIVRIENDAQNDSVPSTMTHVLRVTDFGVRTTVRDATSLVNRMGVSSGDVTAAARALAAAGLAADSVFPLPSNFSPTPGVTLGWSWFPRDAGGPTLTKLLRWLHPGVGVMVSFPRFGRRRVVVTPGSNGAPPSVAETDDVDSVNLAAGPVLTFFDDAVQISVGWNLSVDRKRRFWGLGFSFGRVPGLIANATGREQAVADTGSD